MTITLKNVTKKIRGNTVVDHIDLTLSSGMVYGLCGYNGCGKTMLMRLIAGLIHPSCGEIVYDGKMLGKDIDFPENMGILIENPAFLGGMTGFDNLKLLASIQGKISDDMIMKSITRVGIASAIMEMPDLVILDEPTNALDANGVEITKKIIAEEKERSALVIITCHDQEILEDVCDVIYTIEHGKITNEKIMQAEANSE